MKEYPYERVMRDSRILLIFEVSDYQNVLLLKGFMISNKCIVSHMV